MHLRQSTLWVLAILCLWLPQASASHIVGGEMSYSFIEYTSVLREQARISVTLTLYRDPQGINYDRFASFGVYTESAQGQWSSYETINTIPISPVTEVIADIDPCKTRNLNEARMETAHYTFEVLLDITDQNYLISYQKCCRNYTINNLVGGGDLGSVYDILITPQALRLANNSPIFNGTPPIFICAGYEQNIDQSCLDTENDYLRYAFCTPLHSGPRGSICGDQTPNPVLCPPPYDDFIYFPPFTYQNPMGGNPQITIDNDNGIMTGVPEQTGSYVVAVCVEEYRSGILLSRTRRDYEFNVVECTDKLIARVYSDDYHYENNKEIAYFESCNERQFDFVNESLDPVYIQDYNWQFLDINGAMVYEKSGANERDCSYTFNNEGKYKGFMILNDGSNCYDTAYIEVYIVPDIEIEPLIEFDSCVAGPIQFGLETLPDHSDIVWSWNLGDGTTRETSSFTHSYADRNNYNLTISAIDTFGCTASYASTLDWSPYELLPPDTIQIDTLLCLQDSIYIYDSWISQAGTYTDYIPSFYSGCDSIVKRINVRFIEQKDILSTEIFICQGDTYDFNGLPLDSAGIYLDTLQTSMGCDSVIAIELRIWAIGYSQSEATVCTGESYWFGDQWLDMSGQYIDTLMTDLGCDSIITLDLIEVEIKETEIEDVFCENEPYIYNNESITQGGTYVYTYKMSEDCDSIVTLTLVELQEMRLNLDTIICEGGRYPLGPDWLDTEGQYTYTTTAMNGCDSTVTLNLSVLPETRYEYLDTICLGETYPFGALDLTLPGIYFDTLTNMNGCDSIIILDLIVGQNLTRINIDELEEDYGSTIILEPEVSGGDLINNEWFEVNEFISDELILNYVVEDDNWIYFESTNELFCIAIDSVYIKTKLDINIYFPNVISPNGDGINDLFNIGASATVTDSQLSVFDRWGNNMYVGPVTQDRQIESGWDGIYQNRYVQNGVYTYMVKVNFINGDSEIYGGTLQVVR